MSLGPLAVCSLQRLTLSHMPHAQTLRWLWLACAALFGLALLPMPYSYYALVRVAGFGACGYAAYLTWSRSRWVAVVCGLFAALYNPVVRVHLGEKGLWTAVNVVTLAVLGFAYLKVRGRRGTLARQ